MKLLLNLRKAISRVVACYHRTWGQDAKTPSETYSKGTLFKRFVRCLVNCPRCPAAASGRARLVPLFLPRNEIDVDITNEQLAAAIRIIKTAWSYLGTAKPHYSVLRNEQFLPENLDKSIDEFWASGEAEAAAIQRGLERLGFSGLSGKVCVEYGCGVGRVTMGFARRFALVHGYDISSGHLELARKRADQVGVANINFHQCSEDVVEELEMCDFFYSKIVFQHNPPPVIALLIRKTLAALKPGGIAIFQVPTYYVGYRFKIAEWLAVEHTKSMQMHCLPQQKIFELIAEANCQLLEVSEDDATGEPDKFISNTFVLRKRG